MLATANRKESTNELPNAHDHLFVDPNLMVNFSLDIMHMSLCKLAYNAV